MVFYRLKKQTGKLFHLGGVVSFKCFPKGKKQKFSKAKCLTRNELCPDYGNGQTFTAENSFIGLKITEVDKSKLTDFFTEKFTLGKTSF